MTQILVRTGKIGELEKVIGKTEKKNKKFEVDNSISSYFNDAEEILDRNYLQKIENEKEKLKEIEREYNFSHILKQIPSGTDVFKTSLRRLKKVTTSYDQTRCCWDVWKKTSDLRRLKNLLFTLS